MPRGSKKSAHQHNSRHENGIVAPGKRIRKQKSNGHVNGIIDGKSPSTTPPSPASDPSQPASLSDRSINGSAVTMKHGSDKDTVAGPPETKLVTDRSEESESSSSWNMHGNGFADPSHRRIDVNTAKPPAVPDSGVAHLALTILRSCPLGDTIAILIFLLSVPSTVITLINALFAVFTFVPPAGSVSSFPTTLSDVFQGSGGAPSLATIVLTDTLGLVLWLLVWAPLQTLALELAQAVVATTLGGGNSSKNGAADTTLLCMLIVSVTHFARHKWTAKRVFGNEWSASLSSFPYLSRTSPFLFSEDSISLRSPSSWFRVLIALHILIQGLVHLARRWYTKRDYVQALAPNKKLDPEAIAGSHVHAETPSQPDMVAPGASAGSSDLVSKSSLSNLRDSRENLISGKKKRRQGTYVRSQQPLWAAFAATKVTILREYDQSHALSETVNANATDTKNLGSASFVREEGRVWITAVRSTSFSFDTSSFPSSSSSAANDKDPESPACGTIDRSKPIYVRVNGAKWSSTTIEKRTNSKFHDEGAGEHWTGEVFGLSPACSYNCSFFRCEDDVVVNSLSITTPSSPAAEREPSALVTSPHQRQRPSSPTSPTTTLKTSIAALESSISEYHTRQKRSKKENKAAILTMRKEIDALNGKISKIGSEDKAHSNRHLQWNQHIRVANEAIDEISLEIDSLEAVPENDSEQWREKKELWEQAKDLQSRTREDLMRHRDTADREKSAALAEEVTTRQKRERLQSRGVKLNDQLERLQSAAVQELDDQERKHQEHAALIADRRQIEERSREQIANLQRSVQEVQYHTQQTRQQAQMIESAFRQHHLIGTASQTGRQTPGRQTPDRDPVGTTHYRPTSVSGFRFPAFTTPEHAAPILSNPLSLRQENRPRSTSLLSGNSVYTDFFDQDPAPPMPSSRAMETIRGQQPSRSSGSGSGSISSQRDPISPIGGSAPRRSSGEKRSSPIWN